MIDQEIRVGDIVTCKCDPRKHLLVTNTEGDYKIRAYPVGARMAKEDEHPRNQITVVFPNKLEFHDDPPTREEMDTLRKRISVIERDLGKRSEIESYANLPGRMQKVEGRVQELEALARKPRGLVVSPADMEYYPRVSELEKQVREMTDAITSLESQQQANRAQMAQYGRRLNEIRDTFGRIVRALS